MKFLLFLSNAFINTFGITQPSPENARRMAIFIGALLVGMVLGVALVGLGIRHAFSR